jgi:hypothetical protein
LRRSVAVLVLLSSSLLVPTAEAAVVPATGAAILIDRDGGVYKGDADLSDPQYDSANIDTTALSSGLDFRSSADGTRFVYVLREPGNTKGEVTTRIVVRDASGRLVRFLDGQRAYPGGTGATLSTPSLSPDGNQAVWTIQTPNGMQLRRGLIPTSGRGVSDVPNSAGLTSPVALDNKLTMMAIRAGTLISLTPIGTKRVVSGLPAGAVSAFSVSPDGTQIAYEHAVSGGSAISIAPLTAGTYPSYSAGGSTVLVPHHAGTMPAFSHDGSRLYWSQDDDILMVPVAGGSATNLTNTPEAHETAVIGVLLDDGTAPGPVTGLSVTLGPAPILHWSLPADTDLSGVSVVRTSDGKDTAVRYVPSPLAGYTREYLDDPTTTYHYTVTAVDRSGHPATTKAMLSLQPRLAELTAYSPTSRFSSTADFDVLMPAGTYNLSVRTNGAGPFVRIATGGTGNFVFGQDYGTRSEPGDSLTFRLQVFDTYGNATPITLQPPAVVPYDDTAFSYAGPTTVISATKAFFGTEHVLHDGARATFRAVGNKVTVMGARCRTCASLDVYVDGRRLGLAHTNYLAGPVGYHYDRQPLVSVAMNGGGSHTVTLVARGGNAIVDGLAFRR